MASTGLIPCCEKCEIPIEIPSFRCSKCGKEPLWNTIYAYADSYFATLADGEVGLFRIDCYNSFLVQNYLNMTIGPIILRYFFEDVYALRHCAPDKLIYS